MSECPNCGSAFLGANLIFGRFECGSTETNDPGVRRSRACALIRSLREELAELDERLGIVVSDRDEALSLRAELAKANAECAQLQRQRDDAFRIIELAKDLAAVERDAERDQIADWHENEYEELARDSQCIEHDTGAPCDGCNGCLNHARAMSHLQAAQALRSNEHRSNG